MWDLLGLGTGLLVGSVFAVSVAASHDCSRCEQVEEQVHLTMGKHLAAEQFCRKG